MGTMVTSIGDGFVAEISKEVLGARIAQIRKQRGMSQRELGELIDVSHSFLADIESGRTYPSLPTLQRIAQGLRIPLETLVSPEEIQAYQADLDGLEVILRGPQLDELSEEDKHDIIDFIRWRRNNKRRR